MFYEKFMVFPRFLVENFSWRFQLGFGWESAGGMCLGVWVRSRPSPDGGLSVMQLYRGFVSGSFLSDDHYILGFNIKFSSFGLGFG